MSRRKKSSGYTIIEVMIVLAISGVTFAIAASFISSKQTKTSFRTGVSEMAARIQDVSGQVGDGHFSDVKFSCTANLGANTWPAFGPPPTGSLGTGKNQDCVFFGKYLNFEYGTSAYEGSSYKVVQLAARRVFGSALPAYSFTDYMLYRPVQSFVEAAPTPIEASGIVNLTTTRNTAQSVIVKSIRTTDTSTTVAGINIAGFGFTQGYGVRDARYDPATDTGENTRTYYSGSQVASVVVIPGYLAGDPDYTSRMHANQFRAASNITMCITDGTQYAQIILGVENSQLTVKSKLLGVGRTC